MSRFSALCLVLFAVGCSRDADTVSIARALAENGAALALAADLDRGCGFASTAAEVRVEGSVGQLGAATWTIRDCPLALDPDGACVTRRALGGGAVVSGTRTIVGTVTGDPAMPILADGPDATTISIVATLDGFVGEGRTDTVTLSSATGTLEVEARLRRAMGEGGGCNVPTPNVAVDGLRYAGTVDVIDGLETTLTVDAADLRAVSGQVGDQENVLDGTIEVEGASTSLGSIPLDERYQATAFVEVVACEPGALLPVRYECGAPSDAAAARLAAGAVDLLAVVAQLARVEPTCGFDKTPPVVQANGAVALKRIEACRIDLAGGITIEGGCGQAPLVVSGAAVVTGTMRVAGRSTGGDVADVLPSGDDALAIDLEEVALDGFSVRRGDRRFVASGFAAGRVEPRLARSEETGLCTVATPITNVTDVRLPSLIALLDAPDAHAEGVFSAASLAATIGTWHEENTIVGSVTLSEQNYEIADAFDPSYDRAAFDAGWQCGEVAAANPFVCDADSSVGLDVGRHTVLAFQTLTELLEADEICGFSSGAVKAGTQIAGAVGTADGNGVFSVAACAISFDEPTVVSQDCHGRRTWVEGRAVLSGTKTIDGWVTGDPTEPMLATARTGVRYDLTAELDSLRVWADDDVEITLRTGTLDGVYAPRVAIDESNGACTMLTPEAHVRDLNLSGAAVVLRRAGRSMTSEIGSTALAATIGRHAEDDENRISGLVTIDGKAITLASQSLVSNFDARTFVSSFSCREGMFIPFDDRDCDMKKVLGEVGARLLVQAIGGVSQVAGRDDFDCAFGSRDTLTNPSEVIGDIGEDGAVIWDVTDCRLAFGNNQQGEPFTTNCIDHGSYFDGAATIDGTRQMVGIRDETRGADYIHPQTPNATTIEYRNVVFAEFSSYSLAPGETVPEQQMWIHSGSATGRVEPFMAEGDGSHEAFDEGDYTVPSPLARIRGLRANAIDATILFDHKRFRVLIDDSSIDAFSGSWVGAVGETNDISGTISIAGENVTLMRSGELNPDYDQAELDASYECANRLLRTLPPE